MDRKIGESSDSSVDWKVLLGYRIWAIASMTLLIVNVSRSPQSLKYDEGYHIGLVKLILDEGWLSSLTSEKNQSAAGPLFAAIHLALRTLTELETPAIRWVNVVCLLAVIAITWVSLRPRTQYAFEASVSIIGITFLWPAVGLALTEIPALVAFSLFVNLIGIAVRESDNFWGIVLSCAAGLALGISILGRQTYLVTAPVLVVCAIAFHEYRIKIFTAGLIAMVTCGWLFIIWKGLVPPSQQHTSGGIKVVHGLLGLSYMAAASLILNPSAILKSVRKPLIPLSVISAMLAYFFLNDASVPGANVVLHVTPASILPVVDLLIKSMMVLVGLLWFLHSITRLFRDRSDFLATFETLNSLALAISPAKVSHLFSSRYVVGGIGIECHRASREFRPSLLHLSLLTISSLAGAASLIAYYRA